MFAEGDITTWPQAFALVGSLAVVFGFAAFITWCRTKE